MPRGPAQHEPHVALFDPYAGGHHGHYVRQLVEYWRGRELPGRLDLVVSPRFVELHRDVVELAGGVAGGPIRVVPVKELAQPGIDGSLGLVRSDRESGRHLRRVLDELRPDHCVLMYFDHLQVSLATDLRPRFPVGFSGIYFRPSFHYGDFECEPSGIGERFRRVRKRLLLRAALRNPNFTHLFCLDPYVLPYVRSFQPRIEAVRLPDGVTPRPQRRSRAEVRAGWSVSEDRRVALLFGVIDRRKGVRQVLDALSMLPSAAAERLCLVLAGPIGARDRDLVLATVEDLRSRGTIEVVVDERFIPDEEIQDLLRASDLVLLTYQRHIGSSNVLARAATEGLPVLASDYGLVGALVRRRKLGLTVDATSPRAVADGLGQWLSEAAAFPFDALEARRFAGENGSEQFAATILERATGLASG